MRNRAKCKLCEEVIESLTVHDYVRCKCGEISIDGGRNYFKASAKNFHNFLRVDDEDNVVEVKLIDKSEVEEKVVEEEHPPRELSRQDKIDLVDGMLSYFDGLPQHAMLASPSQYDIQALYLLIKRIL